MHIQYICEFIILAEIGNYHEASEQLFISQSSLSKHIMTMESEFGIPLFDRSTRKVELSEFGKRFLTYAKQIEEIYKDYSAMAADYLENKRERLTIGSTALMAQYGITDMIVKFMRENSDISIRALEESDDALIDSLRSGKYDIVFIRNSDNTDDIVQIPYLKDTVAVIVPIGHPLEKEEYVPIERLRGETFLSLKEDSMIYKLGISICKSAGFQPNITLTVRRGDSLINLVGNGMGIALLSKKAALYHSNPNIAVVDIHPIVPMRIDMVYLKRNNASNAILRFIRYVKAQAY